MGDATGAWHGGRRQRGRRENAWSRGYGSEEQRKFVDGRGTRVIPTKSVLRTGRGCESARIDSLSVPDLESTKPYPAQEVKAGSPGRGLRGQGRQMLLGRLYCHHSSRASH